MPPYSFQEPLPPDSPVDLASGIADPVQRTSLVSISDPCSTLLFSGRGFLRPAAKVLCTPGMGVNLWGESPLYVNSVNVNVFSTLTKVLAEGKGVSVRKGLKGWSEA